VDLDDCTVTIPREEDAADEPASVEVWPLIEAALDKIDADPSTRDAAEAAIEHGDGSVVLANYLNSEAKRVHEMDYRFKVPLVVWAAEQARADDTATSIYDPDEGCVYFETEVSQFSFHVQGLDRRLARGGRRGAGRLRVERRGQPDVGPRLAHGLPRRADGRLHGVSNGLERAEHRRPVLAACSLPLS
jgi:hypothetical protein